STVTFNAASAGHQITSGGSAFGGVVFNNAAGSWTPQDTLMLTGDLTLSAGTLNGGSATISVAGSWYGASGGSFSAGTSTVTFAGAAGSTSTIFGTNTF